MRDKPGVLRALSQIFPGVRFVEAKPPWYRTTAIMEIDQLIGNSWIEGSIIEIFGPSGSGKTSVLWKIAKNLEANPASVLFVDGDHSSFGNQVSPAVLYHRPTSLHHTKELITEFMEEELVDIVMIDSINSIPCADESDSRNHQAELAQFMSAIAIKAAQSKCYVIVTSQVRSKAGIGGNLVSASRGVRPHASVRIYLERLATVKRVKEAGCRIKATLLKGVAAKSKECEFEILFPRREP